MWKKGPTFIHVGCCQGNVTFLSLHVERTGDGGNIRQDRKRKGFKKDCMLVMEIFSPLKSKSKYQRESQKYREIKRM